MPRGKPREVKSAAPSPSPAVSRASSRARGKGKQPATEVVEETTEEQETSAAEDDEAETEPVAVESEAEPVVDESEVVEGDGDAGEDGDADAGEGSSTKLTMAERLAKMKELRQRMNQSTAANRRDLVADHQKAKVTAKELQRLEKQRKLAQTLRLKSEAEEAGEDMERKKAWEWSIEQNERWEAKMEDQKVRGDSSFHNAEDDAHKLYNRNIRSTKPDVAAYARAKEAALGLAPGTLVPGTSNSSALVASGRGLTAAEDLYRGADTLSYGDSKPSEDAIDRVVGKINKDMSKVKRKKKDDGDEEVNYINDRNKVFNKKIARYYDKYTKEIRANFERGTAL
ncbi:SYF2 splicing factor-domain-containing protein [Naematelia encephala]|uniref:Pre-mRNA-splicing factor SYF2 n=1 Tax=Naematelia encephala TaxID=71784 RepID=A0A1Y2B4J3_9TREE|nr:SYF2 splicing factor-domain-containing protein [Naematelia encephala]